MCVSLEDIQVLLCAGGGTGLVEGFSSLGAVLWLRVSLHPASGLFSLVCQKAPDVLWLPLVSSSINAAVSSYFVQL